MTKQLLRSFAGGEVSPDLFGRIDDVKFQSGLALAQNFVTLPHGPARNRPGTEYVNNTKGDGPARLIPFTFSITDTFVVELGAGYFRFYLNGAAVRVADGPAPPLYKPNRTYLSTSVNTTTDEITFATAHGFVTGEPLRFTRDLLGNALFSVDLVQASPATVFYAIVVSPTVLKIAKTAADAAANVAANITAQGSGTQRANRHYTQGELVDGVPAGAPGFWYCLQDPTVDYGAQFTPGLAPAYWYPQPSSGEYEIPNAFTAGQLFDVVYFQSNDVLTLLHGSHAPQELRRYATTDWRRIDVAFAPKLPAPTGVTVTAQLGVAMQIVGSAVLNPLRLTGASACQWARGEIVYGSVSWVTGPSVPLGYYRVVSGVSANAAEFELTDLNGVPLNLTGATTFITGTLRAVNPYSANSNSYRVTAVDAAGAESQASAEVTVTNNLFAQGAYNDVAWNAVSGAVRYRVYKKELELYGLIGSTDANVLTLRDDAIAPDFTLTLPFLDSTLGSAPYPEAGCYHEQRRVFARGQSLWFTRTGTESDLSYSLPTRDDDRIAVSIAATEFSRVRHLVSLDELVALTNSTEFVVRPTETQVLTPSSVTARPLAFVGANNVRPVVVNSAIIYCAARGGHVRELAYSVGSQSLVSTDLSLRATHLFDNRTVRDLAYAKAPYSVVWALSSTGEVFGLTYEAAQQVAGWHRHNFGGTVTSIAVVSEGTEDRLYLLVERTVNGATQRQVCRMAPFAPVPVADSFFVDAGRTFTNVPAGPLSGLHHLAGKTVAILADGIVLPSQVVSTAGQITLLAAYAKVTVGLPIDAQLHTLPVAMQVEGFAQGSQKSVARVWLRVVDSAPFRLGPSLDDLVPSNSAAPSMRGLLAQETLRTERVLVRAKGEWSDDGQVRIVHNTPLPLTIVGMTLDVVLGD